MVTRQVNNLFQDLWNEPLGFLRKVLMQKMVQKCVQKRDSFRGGGGWGGSQKRITKFENPVIRPVFHR